MLCITQLHVPSLSTPHLKHHPSPLISSNFYSCSCVLLEWIGARDIPTIASCWDMPRAIALCPTCYCTCLFNICIPPYCPNWLVSLSDANVCNVCITWSCCNGFHCLMLKLVGNPSNPPCSPKQCLIYFQARHCWNLVANLEVGHS